jgi:VCBS repeat-containing protein
MLDDNNTTYSFQTVIDNIVKHGQKDLLDSFGDRGKPNSDGLVGENSSGWLHPRNQMNAGTYLWVNVGIGNVEKIDDALFAIETAYSFQNADGSLQSNLDISEKENMSGHSFFLSETAYGLLVLSQSDYVSQFQSRIDALLPSISALANWLYGHPDWKEFLIDESHFTNRSFFNGGALYFSGLLLDDSQLINAGEEILDKALAQQDPTEGWYLETGYSEEEKFGGDVSYQFVSLLTVFQIATQKDDLDYQNSFELGWDWAASNIDDRGFINSDGSTRIPYEEKEVDIDRAAGVTLLTGGVFNDEVISDLAKLITDSAVNTPQTYFLDTDEYSSISTTITNLVSIDNFSTIGTATRDGNDLIYDPDDKFRYLGSDELGSDIVSYTFTNDEGEIETAKLSIIISGINDNPITGDDEFTTTEKFSLTIAKNDLLFNDSDIDGDILRVTELNTSLTLGNVRVVERQITYNPNGQFDYLKLGQTATDSFTYTLSDGRGGIKTGEVTITVTGVNDNPVALDDRLSAGENNSLIIAKTDLLFNDIDVDSPTLRLTTLDDSLTLGRVTINGTNLIYNPNGEFDYLKAGHTATDSFSYTLSDGQGGTDTGSVTITVTGVNDNPVAVDDLLNTTANQLLTITEPDLLLNDNDIDGDILRVTGLDTSLTLGNVRVVERQITYNPNGQFDYLELGQTATDGFSYTLSDGRGGTETGKVTITITGVNDDPVAVAIPSPNH